MWIHWEDCYLARFHPRESLRPSRIFFPPNPFEDLALSPLRRASSLRLPTENALPTGTIPTHTAGRAMGGLFYIKQYGNKPTGRKMSNKNTRALPCYYAITYHPFLRPPFNPLHTTHSSHAGTTYIPRTVGYVKQRREYGLMYFMGRATSLSHCRLNMHAGHACTTRNHDCMSDDGANNVIGRPEKAERCSVNLIPG